MAQSPITGPLGDETDDALILYFSFDERDGNQAIDHSMYENHGTFMGNPQLVDGKLGNALRLNSSSDWVEVPHNASLTVDEAVTVMAWINTPLYNGPRDAMWQGILGKSNNPRPYSFYIEADGQLHFSVGAFIGTSSDAKIALNQWQHVVAQMGDGRHRFWINGEKVGDRPINARLPGEDDTTSVRIGNAHDNLPAHAPDRHFLGLIDEVRIYSRALSETEILDLMARGRELTTHLPADVNRDSVVNIIDLIFVASRFGRQAKTRRISMRMVSSISLSSHALLRHLATPLIDRRGQKC